MTAAGGNPESAINYLILDRLAELTRIQTDAIKGIDTDKVVVYDSGNGKGVSNFVQGLYGMVPQLDDFLKQSGMSLPSGLVKKEVPPTNGSAPEQNRHDKTVVRP